MTTKNIVTDYEDLKSKVNDYDIYSYYLGFKPIIGKLYCSPFRVDKNPSFGIYVNSSNNLYYKDFGSNFQGSSISFVMNLFGISTIDGALNKISSDLITKESKYLPRIENKAIYKPLERVKSNFDIKVYEKDFGALELKFWNDYGISENTLKRYNVKSLDKFLIDYGNWVLITKSNDKNPIFCYEIDGKYKLYIPNEVERRNRWKSNLSRNNVQGFNQLEFKSNLLIITKSLKDVMLLHELGYESIAPNSENSRLPDSIIKKIKDNYDEIIILFDNDKAGIDYAKKLSEELDFKYIVIEGEKDISDTYKKFGKTHTITLLNNHL